MALPDRDEYEDLDEYEEEYEDEEEQEDGAEEYYEEEVHQPTEQELEYLELRQKLKESIRKQMKKDPGSSLSGSREKKNTLAYNNFGSFFGPSQPVIAPRVIEESKSLLENPQLAQRIFKSKHTNNKVHASAPAGSSSRLNGNPVKANNVMKTQSKIQMLKNTRDYSFLLSDDAEPPAPKKELQPRNVSVQRPEARSAELPLRSKALSNNNAKRVFNAREESRALPSNRQMKPKGPSNLSSASNPLSSASKPLSSASKPLSSASKPLSSAIKPLSSASKPTTLMDHRKQNGSSNGSGPGRPQMIRPQMRKGLPSKTLNSSLEKRNIPSSAKNSMPIMQKPQLSKTQYSSPKQTSDRRRDLQESHKAKLTSSQLASKPQIKQPQAKGPSRTTLQQDIKRKRPARKYSDAEDEDAISIIRQMFRYNPKDHVDVDDDSDMEANFDDILKEERLSARIAAREDEEELHKIEEEERRLRMRKEAKKRKLK